VAQAFLPIMELQPDAESLFGDGDSELEEPVEDDTGGDKDLSPVKKLTGNAKAKATKAEAKGQPKGKSTPKRKAKNKHNETDDVDGCQYKKCSDCKKFVAESLYNESQTACQVCYNHVRAFRRTCISQGCSEEVAQFKRAEPLLFEGILKAFKKERQVRMTKAGHIRFQMTTLIQEVRAQTGLRKEKESELMWEGEFYEWAKGPKAGYLTEPEMRGQWKAFLADAKIARDSCGPRGYLRLAIPIKDSVKKFEELSRHRSLSQEEKCRKVSPEQMQSKLDAVLDLDMDINKGNGGFDAVQFAGMTERACAIADSSESMFNAACLMGSNVQGLLAEAKLEHKLGRSDANNDGADKGDEEADEPTEENPGTGNAVTPAAKTSPKKAAAAKDGGADWLDETSINKAERSYKSSIEKAKVKLLEVMALMTNTINEFRRVNKDAQRFTVEMAVVMRRQTWLSCVINGSSENLAKLINEQRKGEDATSSTSEKATSRDVSCIVRAAPCRNYEKLQVFSVLEGHCGSAHNVAWGHGRPEEVVFGAGFPEGAHCRAHGLLQEGGSRPPRCTAGGSLGRSAAGQVGKGEGGGRQEAGHAGARAARPPHKEGKDGSPAWSGLAEDRAKGR